MITQSIIAVLAEKERIKGIVQKLRHEGSLLYFDKKSKYYVHFQQNNEVKNICWQRHVSLDNRNWVKWNDILNLKEVIQCINSIKTQLQ
jgi:uncharacterized protein YlbG (UPF0298 family)